MTPQQKSRQRKNSQNDTQLTGDHCPAIRTIGEVFSDGTNIELIREAATGRMSLSSFDGKSHTVGNRVKAHGQLYLPAQIHPTILRAVTLPTRCGEYGSTNQLFAAVREKLTTSGFLDDVTLPTTHFVFASWFPEFSAVAPCLSISGPRSEAVYLLRLLGCLVRHPLRLAEITRAGLCSLPINLQLTFLIDQEPISRSTRSLLSASNHPGTYVPWKGGLADIYCAKAIYVGDGLAGGRVGDSALHVQLAPSRARLPILDANTDRMIADEFQGKMAAYRSQNIQRVRDSQFDLPRLASGTRVLARILGACIVDAPELQAGLEALLRDQEEQARASRWTDLRCVAIEAMLYYCHVEEEGKVYVGKAAGTASTILRGRREMTAAGRGLSLYQVCLGRIFTLDCGATAFELGVGIRNDSHRITSPHAYRLEMVWEDERFVWLEPSSRRALPGKIYSWPGEGPLGRPAGEVLNHRLGAKGKLFPGDCFEGFLLGVGDAAIPAIYRDQQCVLTKLSVFDGRSNRCEAKVKFRVNRSASVEQPQTAGSRRSLGDWFREKRESRQLQEAAKVENLRLVTY